MAVFTDARIDERSVRSTNSKLTHFPAIHKIEAGLGGVLLRVFRPFFLAV
jgi:hypothetical protein